MTLALESEVLVECEQCGRKLTIPAEAKKAAEELSKHPPISTSGIQYPGFYISHCGGYFCNKLCHQAYTED